MTEIFVLLIHNKRVGRQGAGASQSKSQWKSLGLWDLLLLWYLTPLEKGFLIHPGQFYELKVILFLISST